VLQEVGDARRARQYLERALVICERSYGPKHFLVAATLVLLGGLLERTHEHGAASAAYQRAAAIYEAVPGIDPRDLGMALFGVARLAHAQGDRPGCAAAFKRLLSIIDDLARSDAHLAREILDSRAKLLGV
jgi:hypothetical protein